VVVRMSMPCEACWWSPGCEHEEERELGDACSLYEHDGFYPLEEREKPAEGRSPFGSPAPEGCRAKEHRRGAVSGGWNKEDDLRPTVGERTVRTDSKRSVPEEVRRQGERTSAAPRCGDLREPNGLRPSAGVSHGLTVGMTYPPGCPSAFEIIGKLSDFMVWAEQATESPAICAVVYEFAAEFMIDYARDMDGESDD